MMHFIKNYFIFCSLIIHLLVFAIFIKFVNDLDSILSFFESVVDKYFI